MMGVVDWIEFRWLVWEGKEARSYNERHLGRVN